MGKEKWEKQGRVAFMLVSLMLLFNLVVSLAELSRSGLPFMDFHARWQECAYFLRGISPYAVNEGNMVLSIGPMAMG